MFKSNCFHSFSLWIFVTFLPPDVPVAPSDYPDVPVPPSDDWNHHNQSCSTCACQNMLGSFILKAVLVSVFTGRCAALKLCSLCGQQLYKYQQLLHHGFRSELDLNREKPHIVLHIINDPPWFYFLFGCRYEYDEIRMRKLVRYQYLINRNIVSMMQRRDQTE